eukprot:2628092-Rhodomonas_salina.1
MTRVDMAQLRNAATAFDTLLTLRYISALSLRVDMFVTVGSEVVRVTDVDDGDITVTRAQAGTVAAAAIAATAVTVVSHTHLADAISTTNQTTFNLVSPSAAGIEAGSHVQVQGEIMFVVSLVGTAATVTRAQSSTAAAVHQIGSPIILVSSTVLAGSMTTSSVNITVTSASIPNITAGTFLLLAVEIVQVESRDGDDLVVSRGVAGTTVLNHSSGVTVTVVRMTTLSAAGGLSAEAVQITVASAVAIGLADFNVSSFIQVDDEVMRVLAVAGDVLNVSRGAGGTAAASHLDGAKVTAVKHTFLKGYIDSVTTEVILSAANDLYGLAAESHIQVGDEVMRIVSAAGASVVVERAQGDTAASVHADGEAVIVVYATVLISGSEVGVVDWRIFVNEATNVLILGNYIQIDNEILLVDNYNSSVLNVSRAQAGTAASIHRDGSQVFSPRQTTVAPGFPVDISDIFVIITSSKAADLEVNGYIQIEFEILLVTNIDGNNLTVSRGQASTSAASHPSSSAVISYRSTTIDQGVSGLSPGYLSFADVVLRLTSVAIPLISAGDYLQIATELLYVEAANVSSSFSVTRGVAGTVAATYIDGSTVTLVKMTQVWQNAITGSSTSIVLRSASAISLSAAGPYLLIGKEIVRVDAISSNTVTVSRGQAGSIASAHAIGAAVTVVRRTNLDGAIGASDQILFVDAADEVIQASRYIQIDDEILLVTGVFNNGTNISVTRAQEASSAAAHASGAVVIVVRKSVLSMGRTTAASATRMSVLSVASADIVVGSFIAIGSEIALVSGVLVNTITVVRGQKGTSAVSHADGTEVRSILPIQNVGNVNVSSIFGPYGSWDQSLGTLTLSILSGQTLAALTQYLFSVDLLNADMAQASVSPLISATSDTTVFSAQAMETDSGSVIGIAGAVSGDAEPLKVYRGAFTVANIGQNNPHPGINNTITVTIATNVDLVAGSKVTLAGLLGSQTSSQEALQLSEVGNSQAAVVFGNVSSWTKSTGTLVLSVAAGQTAAAG